MPTGAIAGADVAVRRHRLVLRPLTPVPGLWDAMVLHPDDPWVYRVEFPRYGKTWRVVFTDDITRGCCWTSCRSKSGPAGGTRGAGAPASRPPVSLER